jgi:putative drug exporter of the RND superfamily
VAEVPTPARRGGANHAATLLGVTTYTVERPGWLARLAGWSQRHHWFALVLWLVTLAGVTVAAQGIGADYHDDHALPGTQSQEVAEAFDAHGQAGDTVQIVMRHDGGIAAAADAVTPMLREVAELPHVAKVTSPYDNPAAVSDDGAIGYATVTFDAPAAEVPDEDADKLMDTARAAAGDGLTVELGGDLVRGAEESAGGASEGAGLLAALVILVVMFGSFLAAALPVITAVFAVGVTLGAIMLASQLADVPSYAPPLMMLVGLGVGVDYALLIFTRYRGELRAGVAREAAARTALDTAGRSVLFAGATVMIALLGLLALGLGSLRGIALAVTLTVAVTMVASITLLPALLTIFGRRIEKSVLRKASRHTGDYGERWRRWGAAVQRRPWPALVVALAALVGLSIPALDMHLGFADAGTESPDTTSRRAYDLLAEGFGPGFNGPLIVATEGGGQLAVDVAARTLADADGVAGAAPVGLLDDGLGMVLVYPDTAPQDVATTELVQRLRTDVLPPLETETGARYLVGGSTAAADDFAAAVSERLPLFILVVVGLSALLLMVVFRSLLIPLKAALLNLLSIGASLGVTTLVFQQGLFGAQQGPIEAFVPVIAFAIVFGLSMDYEVFLVSRVHEEWRRRRDPAAAVREGLAATGGVITAAAAIMVVVFGAFLLSPDRMLRQFGLALAVAVLIDALVIRCLIVPAVLRLLGARAWWLPRWLDRTVPSVALER